jgi:hypothetical protein
MGKSYDIDFSEYVPFERVSDNDLERARIFNRCRMSETGCWIWTGTMDGKGYGMVSFRSKDRRAHRVSYEVFKGAIPAGMHIRHRCDTPSCVNPAHLVLGTAKDNAMDREARGRRNVRGEGIGTSKLTHEQVVDIKTSSLSNKTITEKYGVKSTHIWRIRSGQSWGHVPTPDADRVLRPDGRGRFKLTLEQALAIYSADPSISHRALAAEYGISASTICQIRKGRTWRKVRLSTEDRS